MSFRLKTIIGIATIETTLLVILILTGFKWIYKTSEVELLKRVEGISHIFVATAIDAVITYDIATLHAFSAIFQLPLLYLATAIAVGMIAGFWWGLALLVVLQFSFYASVRLIEAEIGLMLSMLSILRLTRLGREVEDLRQTRADLVQRIRDRVANKVDPGMKRIFSSEDFGSA